MDDYPDDYSDLDHQMGKVLWSALVHSPWDHAGEKGFYSELRRRTLELRKSTDKALMITCGCNLFEWGTFLRRMDNFLMDIYADPEKRNAVMLMAEALTPGAAAAATQLALAATWAYAESDNDVELLWDGYLVPFAKDSSSWAIDLEGAVEGLSGKNVVPDVKKGYDYEQ